jgi:hypothetical protein
MSETGAVIALNLTLDHASAFDHCYDIDFVGSATPGVDYSLSDDDAAPGIQACATAGSLSAQLSLSPIDDAVFEGIETINASSGGASTSTTLSDNEDVPTVAALAFQPGSISENAGVAELALTLSGTAAASRCYTVQLAGTAGLGVDYTITDDDAAPGLQLCVAAGENRGVLTITALDDAQSENDETVQATVDGVPASLTLIDDDEGAPSVATLAFEPGSISENAGVAALTLTLSGTATESLCFTVQLSGTAGLGVDYTITDDDAAAGVQLCVAAGENRGGLTITALDDSTSESSESVQATVEGVSASLTLIDDEERLFADGFEADT